MHVWDNKKQILLLAFCLLLCFGIVSCKKKDEDKGKKPAIEQDADKNEIELPEDTLTDDETVPDKNPAQENNKTNTSNQSSNENSTESSKENSKEPSKETTEESPKEDSTETPSDDEEEEEARTPIVLPAMKLD